MTPAQRGIFSVLTGVAVLVFAVGCEAAALEGIKVAEGKSTTGSHQVAVTVPGRFKIVVCDGSKVKGSPSDTGVSGFYDLKNDPEEKYNYTPTWSGFFSHKLGFDPRRDEAKGAMMPGPGTVELVEANAVRAVVKYVWGGRAYGGAHAKLNPDVRFEQTFVVSAPDRLYQTFAIVGTGEEVKLTHFSFLLHTSHAKWSGGKTGKGGVFSLPAPWTFARDEAPGPKTHILHVVKPAPYTHADGTTSLHKMNFLLTMHKASGGYGYRANRWVGFRTCLNMHPEDPVITKGRRLEWHAVVVANHDITDLQKAAPYVTEYREPGTPKCAKGSPVADGFNEAMGCYALKAEGGGVDFELPAACHWPAFEIEGWAGDVPAGVTVGGAPKTQGVDYLAAAADGKLILQVAGDVAKGTRIVIQ